MPIFEYQCSACDHRFELLVRGTETVACPDCGDAKLNKLLSAPATPLAGKPLPVAAGCPPSDAPPCSPNCCRL
jgi:putative FmdB family regulatory protein